MTIAIIMTINHPVVVTIYIYLLLHIITITITITITIIIIPLVPEQHVSDVKGQGRC